MNESLGTAFLVTLPILLVLLMGLGAVTFEEIQKSKEINETSHVKSTSELEQEIRIKNEEQTLNRQREYELRIQEAKLEAQKEREMYIKNIEIENKNREIASYKRQAEYNKELYLQTLKRYEQNQNEEIPQPNRIFNSIFPLLILAFIVWLKISNTKIKKAKIKLNKKHKMDNYNSILDDIYSGIDTDNFF